MIAADISLWKISLFSTGKYTSEARLTKRVLEQLYVIGPSKQTICPVELLKRFLHLRRHAHRSDAAFQLKNGSLLTRANLLSVLRKTLNSLNMPAEQFGTHSLRIGSATAAAEAGIPIKIIKAMGRWSSD